jgi:hypothetical protein
MPWGLFIVPITWRCPERSLRADDYFAVALKKAHVSGSMRGASTVLYPYSFLLKDAFYTIVNERRVNGNVLLSVVRMGAIVGGFFFA